MLDLTFLLVILAFAHSSIQFQLPSTYLGDSPYKGLPFGAPAITSAFRIQRDLALNITIDQWLWPAIDLSSAYFGNDYSTDRLRNVEQLFIMGYKRFVLDIYWSPSKATWQFCPEPLSKALLQRNQSSYLLTRDNVHVGDYTCATSYTFRDFLEGLNSYLRTTELAINSEATNLVFLILNLHQLGTSTSIEITESLSDTIQSTFFHTTSDVPRIYTPQDSVRTRDDTPWPQWRQLIERGAQLLVGFGDITLPSHTVYNISKDRALIFNANELGSKYMDWNNVANNTYCNSNESVPNWAFVSDRGGRFNYNSALNVVECGYSPYFTASNYSASGASYSPYDTGYLADNLLSTIWSWDINEPRTETPLHCATTQQWNGRWRVGDCGQMLRSSCRSTTYPEQWVLTSVYTSYDRAFSSCPDGYKFDCPRTARENNQLFQEIKKDSFQRNDTDENISHHLFWINLNSAGGHTCWNAGQYYVLIRVSIVAGIIILILFGIFSWVKCARMWRRRKSQHRKNLVKQILARREYVTVPA